VLEGLCVESRLCYGVCVLRADCVRRLFVESRFCSGGFVLRADCVRGIVF
jgi:hypothetical protein